MAKWKASSLCWSLVLLIRVSNGQDIEDDHSPFYPQNNWTGRADIGLSPIYIRVDIDTDWPSELYPKTPQMCVYCWSDNSDYLRGLCVTGQTGSKMTSWNFIPDPTTRFWCRAQLDSLFMSPFPVYGDGLPVPKESSFWQLNYQYAQRYREDNGVYNDRRKEWSTNCGCNTNSCWEP